MAMNRAELRAGLQVRRRDPVFFLHTEGEYNRAINKALRDAPRALWRVEVDASLSTVAETRRYDLAALGGLETGDQVRALWVEDANGDYNQMGRWQVEDDDGTLTLVLDRDPWDADLGMQLEYLRPHAELADDTTDATMDADWLLARAMTLLLVEADREQEPVELIQRDLQLWDAIRQTREQELLGRRQLRAPKARSRRRG